jgi:hypothetical protein
MNTLDMKGSVGCSLSPVISLLPLADGKRAEVFVSAMGASSYTFACATEAQKLEDWSARWCERWPSMVACRS